MSMVGEKVVATAAGMKELLIGSGISLSNRQLELLWLYHQFLRNHNAELNLTRIHNFENMVQKLYVDSILPGLLMDLPSPLLDLGSGPGMPGIPLKIAFPSLEVYLAESRRKRAEFLERAVETLGLRGVRVIGEGITASFDMPVNGVITRAVERVSETLQRVKGCLKKDGVVVFMKGPACDEEMKEAGEKFLGSFDLVMDKHYCLPGTSHRRRLLVYRSLTLPRRDLRPMSVGNRLIRQLESEKNELFRDLKKLLSSRGIKKQNRALVFGARQVKEFLMEFPDRAVAWVSEGDKNPPSEFAPPSVAWYQLSRSMFQQIDVFGTGSPILLIRIDAIEQWNMDEEPSNGCTLLIPFQDPENLGAVVRSAVAFGAPEIVLLEESAHPFHPKAVRASGGAVFHAKFLNGPSINSLPAHLPVVALSGRGRNLGEVKFPDRFFLLPGIEGPGIPELWESRAVAVPMQGPVESLNASVATAIALYVWSAGCA